MVLGENKWGRFIDIVLGNYFLDLTQKTNITKAKIKKWDNIKLKSFCTAKKTTNKMERECTEWEKIFAKHVSEKELPKLE